MIIITDYKLVYKADLKVFIVVPLSFDSICPCCGGLLHYRDSRKRIRKREGGHKEFLMIRRLYCPHCRRLHNELPDCLVPYKHYSADTVAGVLDGIVTPEDDDAEDYPCLQTMHRWMDWLKHNRANMDGCLRRVGHTVFGLGEELLFRCESVLGLFRKRYPDWLERVLRIIYNSGGSLAPNV